MIAATQGHDNALAQIKQGYMDGYNQKGPQKGTSFT